MRNIPVTAFRVFCYSPWWLLSSTRMLSCVVYFWGPILGPIAALDIGGQW